jgi:Asp-tRNA(Asn)/Glu-tRNA(Gln) amidotransferase A subunit family amidase
VFRDRGKHLIADKVLDLIAAGEKMTIEHYRVALEARAALGQAFKQTAEIASAWISLCAQGPAPVGMALGNPVFADISSNLLPPAVALPLLEVRGRPVGVQLLGMPHEDYELVNRANWLLSAWLSR